MPARAKGKARPREAVCRSQSRRVSLRCWPLLSPTAPILTEGCPPGGVQGRGCRKDNGARATKGNAGCRGPAGAGVRCGQNGGREKVCVRRGGGHRCGRDGGGHHSLVADSQGATGDSERGGNTAG